MKRILIKLAALTVGAIIVVAIQYAVGVTLEGPFLGRVIYGISTAFLGIFIWNWNPK